MPIYEYECGSCGRVFEMLVSRSKSNESADCTHCGSTDTRRIMSGFFGRSGSGDGESASMGGACAGCTAASCTGCKQS